MLILFLAAGYLLLVYVLLVLAERTAKATRTSR